MSSARASWKSRRQPFICASCLHKLSSAAASRPHTPSFSKRLRPRYRLPFVARPSSLEWSVRHFSTPAPLYSSVKDKSSPEPTCWKAWFWAIFGFSAKRSTPDLPTASGVPSHRKQKSQGDGDLCGNSRPDASQLGAPGLAPAFPSLSVENPNHLQIIGCLVTGPTSHEVKNSRVVLSSIFGVTSKPCPSSLPKNSPATSSPPSKPQRNQQAKPSEESQHRNTVAGADLYSAWLSRSSATARSADTVQQTPLKRPQPVFGLISGHKVKAPTKQKGITEISWDVSEASSEHLASSRPRFGLFSERRVKTPQNKLWKTDSSDEQLTKREPAIGHFSDRQVRTPQNKPWRTESLGQPVAKREPAAGHFSDRPVKTSPRQKFQSEYDPRDLECTSEPLLALRPESGNKLSKPMHNSPTPPMESSDEVSRLATTLSALFNKRLESMSPSQPPAPSSTSGSFTELQVKTSRSQAPKRVHDSSRLSVAKSPDTPPMAPISVLRLFSEKSPSQYSQSTSDCSTSSATEPLLGPLVAPMAPGSPHRCLSEHQGTTSLSQLPGRTGDLSAGITARSSDHEPRMAPHPKFGLFSERIFKASLGQPFNKTSDLLTPLVTDLSGESSVDIKQRPPPMSSPPSQLEPGLDIYPTVENLTSEPRIPFTRPWAESRQRSTPPVTPKPEFGTFAKRKVTVSLPHHSSGGKSLQSNDKVASCSGASKPENAEDVDPRFQILFKKRKVDGLQNAYEPDLKKIQEPKWSESSKEGYVLRSKNIEEEDRTFYHKIDSRRDISRAADQSKTEEGSQFIVDETGEELAQVLSPHKPFPTRKSRSHVDNELRSNETLSKKAKKASRRDRIAAESDEWDEDDMYRWEDRRRAKAERKARKAQAAEDKLVLKSIFLPEYISTGDLAQALKISPKQFLRDLTHMEFENVSLDTIMTGETAACIALEYGFEPTVDTGLQRDLRPRPPATDMTTLPGRPPIVTIMGHVDHGKTTLLDWLRKSSVAAQEHGGITQHIGAFVVKMSSGNPITFLDTPGHAAFLSMRKRGANVTDIVVLVVAADDGVMPQTLEALRHATEAKVPIIVAITKVDKPEARIDIVKADLSRHGVEIEDYGGDVQVVSFSGKTGQGMDDLEENIVTLSEVLDVRAEPDGMAEGWVLESSVKQDGKVATILVKRGTLKAGDVVVAGKSWARIRLLRNEAGIELDEALPGTPAEVLGWRDLPLAGELVLQAPDENRAKIAVEYRVEMTEREESLKQLAEHEKRLREKAAVDAARAEVEAKVEAAKPNRGVKASKAMVMTADESTESESRILYQNFAIKADVIGSAEAMCASITELGNNEVQARVLRSSAGQVTEYDVDHAAASNSIIINFNLPLMAHIKQRADAARVTILNHNVIYHVIDDARAALIDILPMDETHRVTGEADVLKIFSINIRKRIMKNIAGCRVRNGTIKKSSRIKVLRRGQVIFDGLIETLRHVKKDVLEMSKGTECGIGLVDFQDLEVDDQVQTYDVIKVKRSL